MIKHLILLKILNLIDIKEVLLESSVNILIKNLLTICVENESISNKQLAGELHKPINKKFKKRKVKPPFKDLLILLICN